MDCETTLGKKGSCKSFRDCYPLFKVADLSGWDGWVMGHYDTCSYVNNDNNEVNYVRQIFISLILLCILYFYNFVLFFVFLLLHSSTKFLQLLYKCTLDFVFFYLYRQ